MSDPGLGKVLVTGCGGFLGSALAAMARGRGLSVRSLSRRFYPHLQKIGVEQIQGDIAEASAVDAAVRKRMPDRLSHCGQGRSLGPRA